MDIGAFESSGFTIAVTSGSGQSTDVITAFPHPLVVTVTGRDNSIEPVAGGLVTFTPPASGASATLSGSPATIGSANGTASVTATTNGIAGSYTVMATASGITTPASFSLTNLLVRHSAELTSPTIVYGTSTTTLTGQSGVPARLIPRDRAYRSRSTRVVQTATVDRAAANFTNAFSTASLGVAGGPYTVTYAFAGSPGFGTATDTSTSVTVTPAPLTVTR